MAAKNSPSSSPNRRWQGRCRGRAPAGAGSKHPFQFEGKSFKVTMSLGLAVTSGDEKMTRPN